jgi:putative transposase
MYAEQEDFKLAGFFEDKSRRGIRMMYKDAIGEMGLKHSPITPYSPWQNPYAERFVGNCRRDLFDRVIVKGATHAGSLLSSYVNYYHEDRTHLGLKKNSPHGRERVYSPPSDAKVVSIPKVGGLHHRYEWELAA